MVSNILERLATTLGVSSKTVMLALFAFFAFIILTSLFRRHKYKRMAYKAAGKTSNGNTWRVTPTNMSSLSNTPPTTNISRPTNTSIQRATSTTSLTQPTDIELPKAIIKQLQGTVADAGKLKALFSKIAKLDAIVSDIGKLEDLTARIDGLEAVVARIEKLQLSSDDKHNKMLQTVITKIDTATNTLPEHNHTPQTAATSPPMPTSHQPQKQPPLTKPPAIKPPPILPSPYELTATQSTSRVSLSSTSASQQISPDEAINMDMMHAEGNDLPEDLHGFYATIITKGVWEKSAIRRVALKNGLMHNSAIKRLNEWANEKYGDYLVVKDEEQFIVQRDIFAPDEDDDVQSVA